jgi:hypothetical protein
VSPVSVELQFFVGDQEQLVETRSTTNGRVNMTGLPTDQPFVVVADADGYVSRRIFVDSLSDRQQVYLLPDSKQSVDPTFTLEDYSGDFDESITVLVIQRHLNGSWQTVEGDYFGASGEVPAILRYNKRHRLRLINTKSGDELTKGSYTAQATQDEVIVVQPGGDIQIVEFDPLVTVTPSTRTLSAVNETTITAALDNQSTMLDSWSVEVTYQNNGSSQTLLQAQFSGSGGGSTDIPVNLTGKAGGEVVVNVSFDGSNGATGSETVRFSVAESYDNEWSLLEVLSGLPAQLPAGNVAPMQTMLAVVLTIILTTGSAAKLQLSTEMVGLTGLGFVAGFSLVGWVPYSVLFVGTSAMIGFIALRRGL